MRAVKFARSPYTLLGVNWCALLVLRPAWKQFSCRLFSFETQSGLLLFTQIRSWLPAAKTLTDILFFCEFSFGADIIIITDPPGRLSVARQSLRNPPHHIPRRLVRSFRPRARGLGVKDTSK